MRDAEKKQMKMNRKVSKVLQCKVLCLYFSFFLQIHFDLI